MAEIHFTPQELKRRKKFFRFKIFIAGFVFLFLLAGLFYFLVYSQFFRLKEIAFVQIKSPAENEMTSAERDKIKADLKKYFLKESGFFSFLGEDNILIWGENPPPETDIFWKIHAELAQIFIKKDFWRKTAEISVRKRDKFGVWCMQARSGAEGAPGYELNTQESAFDLRDSNLSRRDSASCWWFDVSGMILEAAPEVEGSLIYRVDDYSGRNMNAGDLVLEKRLFNNLLKIFEILKKADIDFRIIELERLDLEEATARLLAPSPKIYFSLREDPSFALIPLPQLKNLGLDKAEYIDLRVSNRLYYK